MKIVTPRGIAKYINTDKSNVTLDTSGKGFYELSLVLSNDDTSPIVIPL